MERLALRIGSLLPFVHLGVFMDTRYSLAAVLGIAASFALTMIIRDFCERRLACD